jgi:hypothetical protein|eukprot:COSAG01_NODE_3267_length_6330_cov_133.385331_12_plen_31_part_00
MANGLAGGHGEGAAALAGWVKKSALSGGLC